VSIDIETSHIDTLFGPSDNGVSKSHVFLINSSIHYDATILALEHNILQGFCMSIILVIGTKGKCMLDALQAFTTQLWAKRNCHV